MFKKNETINIIGVGLIGGSLGLALQKIKRTQQYKFKVIGTGRNITRLEFAKRTGIIDEVSINLPGSIALSDWIFICTPPKIVPHIFQSCRKYGKNTVIITDVASIKGYIITQAEKTLTKTQIRNFVGSHPLTGSEKTGAANATAKLFDSAPCIVSPSLYTDPTVLRQVKRIWHLLGCKVVELQPNVHDRILALTSHLPHLVAPGLVNLFRTELNKLNLPTTQVTGPSYRDLTRITAADPNLWTEIFVHNQNNLIRTLDMFIKEMSQLNRWLKSGKFKLVKKYFTQAGIFYRKNIK